MLFLKYERDTETQVSGGSQLVDALFYDPTLEQIARQQGVMPLGEFVCLSGDDEDRAYMTESYDIQPEDMPDPQWFEPDDGLKTVGVLLTYLRNQGKAATGDALQWQVEALEQIAHDLKASHDKGIRFYIAVIPD